MAGIEVATMMIARATIFSNDGFKMNEVQKRQEDREGKTWLPLRDRALHVWDIWRNLYKAPAHQGTGLQGDGAL